MGEGRPPPDAASVSSSDSIRAPPRLDTSRVKPGPGALPADAFDPLKHEDWEQFWYTIDQFFQPVNQDDVRFLRGIPVNSYGGARDQHLRIMPANEANDRRRVGDAKRERGKEIRRGVAEKSIKGKDSPLVSMKSSSTANSSSADRIIPVESDAVLAPAALNSFPFTHRLVAAMLDVGGSAATPAPPALPARSNRATGGVDSSFWIGVGAESDIRSYQKAYEDRVKVELIERGLLDEKEDDELQSAMRMEQWKLRDSKTLTKMRKAELYKQIIGTELRAQAVRREIKRHNDHVEIAYLERMVRNMKKNKKSRSKFQRLLQRMFGHYKEKDKANDKIKKAAETISNGRLLTSGEEKGRASNKKKKKKGEKAAAPGALVNTNSSRTGMN